MSVWRRYVDNHAGSNGVDGSYAKLAARVPGTTASACRSYLKRKLKQGDIGDVDYETYLASVDHVAEMMKRKVGMRSVECEDNPDWIPMLRGGGHMRRTHGID